MESGVSNLLYRCPELYEAVYHGDDHAVPRMCERLFHRHLGQLPASILDFGCGTGRDLDYLAKRCPDCVGVDYLPAMVGYAKQQRPSIDFRVGDMRSLRLGRTFHAIVSFGYAIANIHANADLDCVVATYAAHCEPGALLILEVINATGTAGLPRRFTIDVPGFQAESEAEYHLHPIEQLLERRRTWTINGGEQVHDSVRFRLLYPKEPEYYLTNHGFDVLEIHDNTDLVVGELTGPRLYVVARYRRQT